MNLDMKTVFSVNTTFQTIKCTAVNRTTDKLIFKKPMFYELEKNHCLFCLVTQELDELELFVNQVSMVLDGDYLFISIFTNIDPFILIAINALWLKEQTPYGFDLKDGKMELILKKVQTELSTKYSLFSSNFLGFHKQFNESSFKRLSLQTYCLQFIFDFLQFIDSEINENEKLKTRSLEIKKIIEIQEKILTELHKSLPTVKDMAGMAGMSVSKFKILFNDIYKESPHQHILEKKLLYAKDLLQSGNYSIAQVSDKVGFNHPSGFTRLFKNRYKHPPRAFNAYKKDKWAVSAQSVDGSDL
jgi:AraC-like DNA-binding protein